MRFKVGEYVIAYSPHNPPIPPVFRVASYHKAMQQYSIQKVDDPTRDMLAPGVDLTKLPKPPNYQHHQAVIVTNNQDGNLYKARISATHFSTQDNSYYYDVRYYTGDVPSILLIDYNVRYVGDPPSIRIDYKLYREDQVAASCKPIDT